MQSVPGDGFQRVCLGLTVAMHQGFFGTPAHGFGIVGSFLAFGSACIMVFVLRG